MTCFVRHAEAGTEAREPPLVAMHSPQRKEVGGEESPGAEVGMNMEGVSTAGVGAGWRGLPGAGEKLAGVPGAEALPATLMRAHCTRCRV